MTRTKILLTGIGILALAGLVSAQDRGPRHQAPSPQPQHQSAPPPQAQQRPSPERYMMGQGRGPGMMEGRRNDQSRGQAVPRGQGAMYGRGPDQGHGVMVRPPQRNPGAIRGGPSYPMVPQGRALPRNERPRWPLYEQRRHRAFQWNLGIGGVYLGEMGYYGNYPVYPYDEYYADSEFGRVKVKGCPRYATVLVNEGVIGLVDDADGLWQEFVIPVGQHIIRIVFDDNEVAGFNVFIRPYATMTLHCGR